MSDDKTLIEIHTSDRTLYKRCRRRFGWASTLRENLIRIGPDQKAFFLGTGFHFALEDYWGYRRFAHPAMAFAAYFDAQKPADLPDEADDALELATDMLTYYVEDWLIEHPEDYETLWVDGVPQVEVEVAIRLNELLLEAIERDTRYHSALGQDLHSIIGATDIEYVTTFDRVVLDQHSRLWGMDYKTAASFDELNLQTNPQAGSYDWAMDLFYTPTGYKPEGIIWHQFKKTAPKPPKLVNSKKKSEGKVVSVDFSQPTTYRLYKKAVVEHHGLVLPRYESFLAFLGEQQDYWGDNYIRRDPLRRNAKQREVEQEKIVAETLEMLDPELPLYPNPTKDCSWDCPFKAPCLAKDDGSDYEHILANEYTPWAGYKDDWRSRVKYPDAEKAEPTLSFD